MVRPCVQANRANPLTHAGVMLATVLALSLPALEASAQQWELAGRAGLGTGVEAGDPGLGEVVMRRARTRVLIAVDAKVDERPKNAYELVAFAEVEPHTSFGGELRLSRSLGSRTRGFVGMVGVAAPHTLFGGDFGLRMLLSDDPSEPTFFLEPSVSVLPLGTDLAGEHVLVWGLLSVGIHGNL